MPHPSQDSGLPSPEDAAQELGERLAQHGERLRLLVQHLCGPALRQRIEVEDLVQEVYLRALGSSDGWPALEAPADARLWHYLVGTARHTVIDVARSLRAAKRDGQTRPLAHSAWSRASPRASQLMALTRGPLTRLAAVETAQHMRSVFEALSPEHRRVLGFRQFEGLSARETAARMGQSESSIHSLYRRALGAWQAGLERDSQDYSKLPRRIPRGPTP